MSSRSSNGWEGVEAIIFDAVGTLIEPSPSVARVYAAEALRQGLVVEEAEVKSRFRRFFRDVEQDDRLGPMRTDEEIEARRWRRIVANVLPDLPDLDLGYANLWEHFGRAGAWRCFDDVGPTLRKLRDEGWPIRIASNFDGRLRGVSAGLADLAGFADILVISAEVGYRKPHARFYEAAAASLGLPPARVLCVGDDPENDVAGAQRAGMPAILLDRDGRAPAGTDAISRLDELVGRLAGSGPRRAEVSLTG